MLGNSQPLWEVDAGRMKLGAVIIPATTLLGPADLADRVERGDVAARGDRVGATPTSSPTCPATGPGSRSATRCAGLAALRRRVRACSTRSPPTVATRADDPLLLYFTSGTTAQPKLVEHTHASLPGRAPVHDVLDRPAARRRAPEHLLAGLGEARVEQRVRAVERRRDRAASSTSRGSTPARAARRDGAMRRHHVLRAADRVADARPGGPGRLARAVAARGASAPASR